MKHIYVFLLVSVFGICAILLGYGRNKRKQEAKKREWSEWKETDISVEVPNILKANAKRARRRARNLYLKTRGGFGRKGLNLWVILIGL